MTCIGLFACTPDRYKYLELKDIQNSEGWYEFPEFKYKGEIRNGQPNGQGIVRYTNNVSLQTSFVNGIAQGNATLIVPEKVEYKGVMQNGQFVRGHARYANGTEYSGEFKEWEFDGYGSLYKEDGSLENGYFTRSKLNGEGFSYNAKTGSLIQGNFRSGLPQGTAVVNTRGVISLEEFDSGRNITLEMRKKEAQALIIAPLEQDLKIKTDYEKQAAIVEASTSESITRIDSNGLPNFESKCGCYKVTRLPSGGLNIIYSCLEVEDSRLSQQEKEEADRVFKQYKQMCDQWSAELRNPSLPSRLAELRAQLEREKMNVSRARIARENAARTLATAREEARLAQSARMQREIQNRISTANAEAQKRNSEMLKRCEGAPSTTCGCAWLNKPATASKPLFSSGSATASCQ